jgi:hypothetical protein
MLWGSLFWIDLKTPDEFYKKNEDYSSYINDETGGLIDFQVSLQISKIDPNSDAAIYHGGSLLAEINLKTNDYGYSQEFIDLPDSYEKNGVKNTDELISFISKKLRDLEIYVKKFLNKRYKKMWESYNFERGEDPKKTMRIGKASFNPFLNGTFKSMSLLDYLKKEEEITSFDIQILEAAAKLLGVDENQVLIALDSNNYMLDHYDLANMNLDNWENTGEEIEINSDWYLVKDTNDVVYVIKTEEGERFVLGKNI